MPNACDRIILDMTYEVALDLLSNLEIKGVTEGPLGGPLGLLRAKLSDTILKINTKGSRCPKK